VVERNFWAQADLVAFGMAAAVLHTEMADGRLRLVSSGVFLWHEPLLRWCAERGFTRPGWTGLAVDLALIALVVGVHSTLS
jgi:hypothetical protein